jgi:NADH-quinone oxidoreductase subunit J
MTATVDGFAAIVLGVVVAGSAIGMLTTKNVVHAAFWMLASMLGTAGIYMLLSAEFVALVQIMVYAGAVAVLLLFVIMLTLRRREDAIRSRDFSLSALAVALLVGALVAVGLRNPQFVRPSDAWASVAPGIAEFGRELFSTWMLPFEMASLLLTVALVGAVWWSQGGGDQ